MNAFLEGYHNDEYCHEYRQGRDSLYCVLMKDNFKESMNFN